MKIYLLIFFSHRSSLVKTLYGKIGEWFVSSVLSDYLIEHIGVNLLREIIKKSSTLTSAFLGGGTNKIN